MKKLFFLTLSFILKVKEEGRKEYKTKGIVAKQNFVPRKKNNVNFMNAYAIDILNLVLKFCIPTLSILPKTTKYFPQHLTQTLWNFHLTFVSFNFYIKPALFQSCQYFSSWFYTLKKVWYLFLTIPYFLILFFWIYGSSKISFCCCKEVTDAKREAFEPMFDVHGMGEKLYILVA